MGKIDNNETALDKNKKPYAVTGQVKLEALLKSSWKELTEYKGKKYDDLEASHQHAVDEAYANLQESLRLASEPPMSAYEKAERGIVEPMSNAEKAEHENEKADDETSSDDSHETDESDSEDDAE